MKYQAFQEIFAGISRDLEWSKKIQEANSAFYFKFDRDHVGYIGDKPLSSLSLEEQLSLLPKFEVEDFFKDYPIVGLQLGQGYFLQRTIGNSLEDRSSQQKLQWDKQVVMETFDYLYQHQSFEESLQNGERYTLGHHLARAVKESDNGLDISYILNERWRNNFNFLHQLASFYHQERMGKLREYFLKESSLAYLYPAVFREEDQSLMHSNPEHLIFYAPFALKLEGLLGNEKFSSSPFEVGLSHGELRINNFHLGNEEHTVKLYDLLEYVKKEQKEQFSSCSEQICSNLREMLQEYMMLCKHLDHLNSICISICPHADFPERLNHALARQKKGWDLEKESYRGRIDSLSEKLKEEFSVSDVSFERDSDWESSIFPEANVLGQKVSNYSRKKMIQEVMETFQKIFS